MFILRLNHSDLFHCNSGTGLFLVQHHLRPKGSVQRCGSHYTWSHLFIACHFRCGLTRGCIPQTSKVWQVVKWKWVGLITEHEANCTLACLHDSVCSSWLCFPCARKRLCYLLHPSGVELDRSCCFKFNSNHDSRFVTEVSVRRPLRCSAWVSSNRCSVIKPGVLFATLVHSLVVFGK